MMRLILTLGAGLALSGSASAQINVETPSFSLQLTDLCPDRMAAMDITPCLATFKATSRKTRQSLSLRGVVTYVPGPGSVEHSTYTFIRKDYVYVVRISENPSGPSTLWILKDGKLTLKEKVAVKY